MEPLEVCPTSGGQFKPGAIQGGFNDGGHTTEQQQTTLEEMLPYLRPGGVYLCEDVCGRTNALAAFASGLVDELNCFNEDASRFQSSIH